MFRLRVIAEKLNIRNSPVADINFVNWIGDSLKGEMHFAEKKVKGEIFEGIDDWYIDGNNRFYWAGGVVEVPLPLSPLDIAHFESIARFPAEKIIWRQKLKNIPEEITQNMGRGVKIGLLDSGIEQKHADLSNAIFAMRDFTNSPYGCQDIVSHGSFMASLLCAKGFFKEKGLAGICTESSLVLAKVIYESNEPDDYKHYVEGIAFAVNNGSQVVNMSFGISTVLDIPIVSNEIDRAVNQGVVFVASTKQVNFPVNNLMQYPASHPKVIAVVAVTPSYFAKNELLFPKGLIIMPRIKVEGAVNQSNMFYASDTGSSVGTAIITGLITLLIGAGRLPKRDKDSILQTLNPFQSSPETLFDSPANFIIQP